MKKKGNGTIQFNNKQTLSYENGELVFSNEERERERERDQMDSTLIKGREREQKLKELCSLDSSGGSSSGYYCGIGCLLLN